MNLFSDPDFTPAQKAAPKRKPAPQKTYNRKQRTLPMEDKGLEDNRELVTHEYCILRPNCSAVFIGFTFDDGRMGEAWVPISELKKVLAK